MSTVLDYIRTTANADEIAGMMVYPHHVYEQGGSYDLWNFKKINGKDGLDVCAWTKEEAIEKAKAYLNQNSLW